MVFLDSSVIIEYLSGSDEVVAFVDRQTRLLTSSLCTYEVLEGEVLGGEATDIPGARQAFGRVQSVDFDEEVALEAARMQDRFRRNGAVMPTYDLLIAATARSVGDTLVTTDDDFVTEPLDELLAVNRL